MFLSVPQKGAAQDSGPSGQVNQEPFYLPVGDEVRLFEAAHGERCR
jgi:hypothetical protein